jgi:hypothetical protein
MSTAENAPVAILKKIAITISFSYTNNIPTHMAIEIETGL